MKLNKRRQPLIFRVPFRLHSPLPFIQSLHFPGYYTACLEVRAINYENLIFTNSSSEIKSFLYWD